MAAPTNLIERINRKLRNEFGLHDNNEPKFRLVWSDDQYEYRYGEYNKFSEAGLFLKTEIETKYVPKYRQWIPNQWVLERLTPVPETDSKVIFDKLSYEPVWAFADLNPDWEVCKIICEKLLNPDKPIKIKHETEEERQERIRELEKYLFQDDMRTLDTPFVGYGPINRNTSETKL